MGKMIEYTREAGSAPGYLALPASGEGPGVVVLHTWWGLTNPFKRVCDRLAQEGFVALSPDLYHGKTADTPEEAGKLGDALDQDVQSWRGDIRGAVEELRRHDRKRGGKVGFVGFSLGASYALDMSVRMADEVAAVAIFYVAWAGPEFAKAKAAYLCHFAEDDPFEQPGAADEMVRAMKDGGRTVSSYRYPRTKHWFFEDNRPEYNPEAAKLAWERTLTFLHKYLD